MYQKLALKLGSKLAVTGLTLGKAVLGNLATGLAVAASEVVIHKISEYKKSKQEK